MASRLDLRRRPRSARHRQKGALHSIRSVSNDLHTVGSLLVISLKLGDNIIENSQRF
jgi:hypothetical protein